MLKTYKSNESITRPGEGKVGVSGNSRARRNGSKLDRSKLDGDELDGGKVEDDEVKKKKMSQSKTLSKSKKTLRSSDFLTLRTKLVFTKLRQVFFKTPILYHFDSKRHIWIETDLSRYTIGGVLSQLISDDLG